MDIRLHNLLYLHHHPYRCALSDRNDCRLIGRKNAILHTQQSKPSSLKDFYMPTLSAATMTTNALVASRSSKSSSSGSARKKRGEGVPSKTHVSPNTTASSFLEKTDKDGQDVRRDFEYADGLDSNKSNREKELGHFMKLINRSCRTGNYDEALYFLKRMVSAGYFPGARLCSKLINGFSSSASSLHHLATCAISKAEEVMEILENHGSPEVYAYNALLTVIHKAGTGKHIMELGTAILDRMRAHGCSPDIQTYNILIDALCHKGRLNSAMKVLDRLLQDNECQATVITYTILIDASINDTRDRKNGEGKGGGISLAIKLLEEMVAKGLQPNSYTYNAILRGMCKHGLVDQACQLVRTLSRGHQPSGTFCSSSSSDPAPALNVMSYNIVLRSLLDMRRWEDAEKLVSEMVSTGQCRPNVVTLNILINYLCHQGMVDTAIKVIDNMMTRGLKLDYYSFDPIIFTYCKQGRMDLAITFVERVLSCGYALSILNYNTILGSLCRSGATFQALEVLDMLEEVGYRPNAGSYNAVIKGLWSNGDRTKAVEILSQMIDKGIRPDWVTYKVVISCLCRDGLADHAIQLMADMEDTWGYIPNVITYNTAILGLSKAHRIDAAIDILGKMIERGCMPNETTYKILVDGLAYAGHEEEAAEVGTTLLSYNAISRDSIRKIKKNFPGLQI